MKRETIGFTGFKDLQLNEGEELEIVKGITLEQKPIRCIVIKEYPRFLLLDLEFENGYSTDGKSNLHRRECVNKGAMLCGDVVIRRNGKRTMLTGEEVGILGVIVEI